LGGSPLDILVSFCERWYPLWCPYRVPGSLCLAWRAKRGGSGRQKNQKRATQRGTASDRDRRQHMPLRRVLLAPPAAAAAAAVASSRAVREPACGLLLPAASAPSSQWLKYSGVSIPACHVGGRRSTLLKWRCARWRAMCTCSRVLRRESVVVLLPRGVTGIPCSAPAPWVVCSGAGVG
jgi:hypothetical protein